MPAGRLPLLLMLLLASTALRAADGPPPISASPPTTAATVSPSAVVKTSTPPLPTVELRVQQTSVTISHALATGGIRGATPTTSGIQITVTVADVPGWRILSLDDLAVVDAALTGGEALTGGATPPRRAGYQSWMQGNILANPAWSGDAPAPTGILALALPQHGALSLAHLQIKGTLLAAAAADDTHVPVALTAGTATQVNAVPEEPMSFLLKADGTVDYQSPCFWIPLLVGLHLRDAQQHELTRKQSGRIRWNQVTLAAAAPIAGIDLDVMSKAHKLAFSATWGTIPLMDAGDGKEPAAVATVTDAGEVDLVAALRAAGGVPQMNRGFRAQPVPPPAKPKPGANF